ncbi:REP-associated tyrosine transposase [Gudongella sp. DL1XJH-153]|uniref:REP-associated tyrosine transposase n=1 Tax=Gudongella sp. DL1XJH-153 TaxID=3409804 RepID=UPI003BB5DD86
MPRTARVRSRTGIYHLMLRGINRQTIFEDNEDAQKFLYTLEDVKNTSGFEIYAYCLMTNHIHLLVKEGQEDFGQSMRRIGAKYVYWYNMKYERTGHLFQDRFKSEVVENEEYLLSALRYIHQNPVTAGMVKDPVQYPWSSYSSYLNTNNLIDADFILEHLSTDKNKARDAYVKFHKEYYNHTFLDMEDDKKRLSDDDAKSIIINMCNVESTRDLQGFDKRKRDHHLVELSNSGISDRQISRLTGISRAVIRKAK